MKTKTLSPLDILCSHVRESVQSGEIETCIADVHSAMAEFPDAPQPHNLLGILLEKMGDHSCAMRHFRAAWALDPTYAPAEENLKTYATFSSRGRCAFDESDCPQGQEDSFSIIYDGNGVGRILRRNGL